jgi:hypothetical protein
MLLTGEDDYRTPIAESEQYYQALQAAHPRRLALDHRPPEPVPAKVAYILAWFERFGEDD